MAKPANPITEDRSLTIEEESLVRWLLAHSNKDGCSYLPQVDHVWVVSRCPCGCATISFSVNGERRPDQAMKVIADFTWSCNGHRFGVFVFERGGLLAGLEVWSIDGEAAPSNLPRPDELQPLQFGRADGHAGMSDAL
jgi:hypothetical protein